MSDRFKDNELKKVQEHFREHPLMRSCQRAFRRYQAKMQPLLFAPEEVFCEAAIIIDHIFELPQSNEVQTYIVSLWDELRIKMSKWEKTASPQNLDMAISAVLYTVAIAMSRHWTTFYNFDVTQWLLQAIIENMKVDHQEMVRVFNDLLEEGDGIEDWINDDDTQSLSLTDEIEQAITTKNGINTRKPEGWKDDKKPFDPDTFRETFTYWPDGMSEKEREIRLKMVFNRMRGTLIDRDTHYDTFEALLSGKPLDVKIVWVGINSQLRNLFNQLVTKKKLFKKPTGGLNQILTARFKKEDGTLFTANEIKDAGSDGDMSAVKDVVSFLTPAPVTMEDLEHQLSRLIAEERERADQRGLKDNKRQKLLPKGTNVSTTPNQHTRTFKKKE